MVRNTDGTDEPTNKHPAADIETIVVDPDDVVETMRRNKRDENQQRSHVLRVSPPLKGERKATPHVSEAHTHYPPEMDPKPIHLPPAALVVGHAAGSRHPDWRNEWSYPNLHEERSLFRDEFDAHDENGENRPLTDEEEDEWEEWWDTAVEMWEDRVRQRLKNVDELTLDSQYPEVEDTTVAIRIESDD